VSPSPIKSSSETSSPLGKRAAGLKQSWRVFWFGVAFIVFTVLTYLAFFHARLGSVSRPSFFSIGWWLQPIEFNALGRISHVESGVDFTCISALAGGREIWVGGSKGVIIHSTDEGKTWEKLPTVTAWEESSATKTQSTPTPTPQPKSKAFYPKPSDLRSRRVAGANPEREEWIQVGLPERTPARPDMRQQQIVPNAANQAAPRQNASKYLPIDVDQTAPTLSPSGTERGVTGIPAIRSEVPKQSAPTSNLPQRSRFTGVLAKGETAVDPGNTPAYHAYRLWLRKHPLFPLDALPAPGDQDHYRQEIKKRLATPADTEYPVRQFDTAFDQAMKVEGAAKTPPGATAHAAYLSWVENFPTYKLPASFDFEKATKESVEQEIKTMIEKDPDKSAKPEDLIAEYDQLQTEGAYAFEGRSRFLTSNNISELQCIRAGLIYALTSAGELIVTRDRGENWRLLNLSFSDRAAFAVNVKFSDDKSGICVGNPGSFEKVRLSDFNVTTTDGGESWSEPMPAPFAIADVALMGGLEGQAVGKAAQVLEVAGGKLGRLENISGLKDPFGGFLRITRTTAGSFFTCGVNGTIARSVKGGRWQAVDTNVIADLHGISFASDRTGWAVGKKGVAIATRDGGDHWEKQASGINWNLRAVYFSSEARGFAAGDNGTLIGTEDGGRHWNPVVLAGSGGASGYVRLPAPWYFVSLLLLFGLVRKIPEEIVPPTRQGIAELLASDKPIGPEDPDYLGFRQVALGLSNYLRNNATKPPLTVAVTGEWGMGKSSLMNLVQGDLRSYKFRPVWFNAWHHQTEESLLAALLENVRTQAIPSIFTPEGIVFRVKLLWLRARKNLFVFLLVVAAISFCIGYFAADPHRLTRPPEALMNFFANPSETEEVGKAVLVLASAIAALITFLKGFRAFGADPSSLLASKSNAAKAKDLRAQTSFRYRFENQFREVTDSLNPLTMVLFVDDLDRCRPEEVYNMLEAINFLVSCGDCFVIMGLARRRVERCVGLVFEKVAAEGPDVVDDKQLSDQQKRERFAQVYLEKLINIEVPVPKGVLEQIRTLLTSKKEEPPPRSRVEIVGERLSDLVPHLIPASLAAVAAMIAVWCSLQVFAPGDSRLHNARVAPEASAPQVQTGAKDQGSANAVKTSPEPTASPAGIGSAKFFPGQSGKTPLWAILLVATGILTPGIIRLSRRTGSVIEDSPAFIEALDKWFPFLVTGRELTPRAIKRFVNRVRYFAMMEGSFRPARRWWERLAQFLERKEETAPQAPPTGTREDLLVALATIHERHSEWFTGDRESFVATFLESIHGAPATEKDSLLEFEHLVVEVDQPTYEHFKKLVAGVEVR
jgi:photosystem II stability/assembly factor-like uncharacterized protein